MCRDELAPKRHGHSYCCTWPYWICIWRSLSFRRKIYGRRVFKWITQQDLLMFALVKLLVPLFNVQKKHVINYFALEMAAIVVDRRKHAPQRTEVHGRREMIFSTRINLFGMPEEHIIRTYRLPSHVIFNLLQEIKDALKPSTRSHAIPGLSKLLASLNFLAFASFQRTVASLFLYSLFATIC